MKPKVLELRTCYCPNNCLLLLEQNGVLGQSVCIKHVSCHTSQRNSCQQYLCCGKATVAKFLPKLVGRLTNTPLQKRKLLLQCIMVTYGTQATGCYTEVTFLHINEEYKQLSYSPGYIEIKYYSVAYFERITEFDAL